MILIDTIDCWIPWVLDECNDDCVCVKDSRGEIVFFEDFNEKWRIWAATKETKKKILVETKAKARLMVSMSEYFASGQKEYEIV